ncbi:helix-turn-helix domain-containing protein [Micromonospora matsumotoense]|uniref:helix-turn-helix domain-containing protein n=1 Tax=Micromonospora matsumotoense TaxID=121616 RepID=UPI0033CEA830
MGRGRPKAGLTLTDEERDALIRGARAAHSTQSFAIRCRIVLACAEGATNIEVATRLNVSPATVGKWRARFASARLPGLADEPRTGRPPSVRPEQVDRVVADTLDGTPAPARRWSRASMAARTGLSASTVGRIWRQFDLRPHLQDGLTLAADPGFVDSVVALVGLYRHPREQALVLCAVPRDDRSRTSGSTAPDRPEQLASGPARPAPAPRGSLGLPTPSGPTPPGSDRDRPGSDRDRPGSAPDRPGSAPDRPGSASDRPGSPTPVEEDAPQRRRRAAAYRRFLVAVDRVVPAGLLVHVVADDPALHDAPTVRGWLTRHPRFHLHLTPAGGSWADQVRRWSGLLAARHPDGAGPVPHGGGETAVVGEPPTRWINTPEEMRQALARHHQRTSGASVSADRPAARDPSTRATGM